MKINLAKYGEISLVSYVDLTDAEKLKILEVRNHPDIRKWMYNQEIISTPSHLNFIDSLKSSRMKQYFFVKKSEKWIGVLYFINIEPILSEAEFGLYANPFEITPGIGRILEMASIQYAFETLNLNKLKLEVFSDNKQVVNLHKKYHFEYVGEKVVGEKKVLCMELCKADRKI